MFNNSSSEYGLFSKLLHWLMAIMIIVLIGVGLYMAGLPKETTEQKQYAFQFYDLHKPFGAIMLMLIIVRLSWLRLSPPPELPAVFDAKEKTITLTIRSLLYALMLLIPVSGYIMSNSAGHPINFFGLINLPAIVGKSEDLRSLAHTAHKTMAFAILALIALHIAGVLKHRIKDKDGDSDLLKRML